MDLKLNLTKKWNCTACDKKLVACKAHPILNTPICDGCWKMYHSGEFTVTDGNENYCRWCGEGGELCLCDSCPKGFCNGCILRNFGVAELHRITQLRDRWSCYVCSPQIVEDLSVRNGWYLHYDAAAQENKPLCQPPTTQCIYADVSRGRERFKIPVFNEVDSEGPPLDFVYVTKHVSGGATLSSNPNFLACCTCTDNCRNPKTCECALSMNGNAYSEDKMLLFDKPSGIYECNQRCPCHISRCHNRVVGNGPTLPLQVFRCQDPRKGWGVRCAVDIAPGTYVADYIGELMIEGDAERRGLSRGDEYLFSLDNWGRSQACQRLCDLGLKRQFLTAPAETDVDTATANPKVIQEIVGDEMFSFLKSHGVVDRVKEIEKETKNPLNSCSLSWEDSSKRRRLQTWRKAKHLITDRAILDAETQFGSYTIDARWFGSVGRFLNHSCQPNCDIITVFVNSQDVHIPRVAFFSNEFIKAGTEICYDYGYFPGNVDGKHRNCLCGSVGCRKVLY